MDWTRRLLKRSEYENYLDIKAEWRVSAPIKNSADFCFYIEGNGVDDDGNVIPSSAYLAEHKGENGFFAVADSRMLKITSLSSMRKLSNKQFMTELLNKQKSREQKS